VCIAAGLPELERWSKGIKKLELERWSNAAMTHDARCLQAMQAGMHDRHVVLRELFLHAEEKRSSKGCKERESEREERERERERLERESRLFHVLMHSAVLPQLQ
jgi:hypothetical protein